MTKKTPDEARLQQLRDIINALPENMKGIHGGFKECIGELRGLPYRKDIETLARLMDYFAGSMRDNLELQMCANVWHVDRYLLESEILNNAPKSVQKKLQPFTEFMEPTARGLIQFKYHVLDMYCWICSLYGLLSSVRALKKAIGADEGFNFIEDCLQLKKTSIKWKTSSLKAIKEASRNAETYQFEDYLSCLNKSILELSKHGIFIKLPPLDFAKLRPTAKTINAIVASGSFFSPWISLSDQCGNDLIYMSQFHEAYREQVAPVFDEIEDELILCEREMYPQAYINNRD